MKTTPTASYTCTWTPLQDALLLDAVEKRQFDWNLVSENVFGKSWADCKARYEQLQTFASSPNHPSDGEAINASCKKAIKSSLIKSPHKVKHIHHGSVLSKLKRSPAAIKVVQKIMQARTLKSPGKLNKGTSPVRQTGNIPTTLYGSPLQLKLFNKTPGTAKNQNAENHLRSEQSTNQSPSKFDWKGNGIKKERQYAESSPTLATQYPASLSPFLLSNAPSDPSVSKLKRNYESRSSPSFKLSRDSPFQAPPLSVKKHVSPIKPYRRISPKKSSSGSNVKITRPSPSSLLKSRSTYYNKQDVSPSRSSKNIPSTIQLQSSKTGLSPSRLKEISRSPKVSSPLRFEGKKTSKLTPKKSSKNISKNNRSWGASPAKNLSSTLDYLHPEQVCRRSSKESVNETSRFDSDQVHPCFDFEISGQITENEINPYGKEIIPAPFDQAMIESFLSPPPVAPLQHQDTGRFWNDLFSSEGNFGVPHSEYFDVEYSAPARMNEPMSTTDMHIFSLFGNQEEPPQNSSNPSHVFDNDVEIPRDEVDDLFKEAAQENGYSEVLQKQSSNGSKKKGINWLVNSTEGFSVEQVATLKNQIFQSFQLCTQLGSLEREATGRSDFWEDQMNILSSMKQQGVNSMGPKSVFNIPGLELAQQIQSCFATKADPNFDRKYINGRGGKNKLDLPVSVSKLLKLLSSCFNPSLMPKLKPTTRPQKGSSFSTSEDALLFQGVVTFGENDPFSIQSHCLPGRSILQIANRIRTLTKRNKGENSAIKDFLLLPFKPMNYNEKFLLRQGVLKYGIEFKKVTSIVFPHIPGPLLETAWTELHKIGQIPIPWNHNKKTRPKSKISKLNTLRNPSNIFKNVLHSEPIIQARVPFSASQQISSIPLPKRLSVKERTDAQNSDYENKQDDDSTLLESKVATPLPEPIPFNPVRGAGRGANPARKKRGRIDKDIIDTSVSIKKLRRITAPIRKLDVHDIEKSRRKQKPIPKTESEVDSFNMI